MFQRDYIMRMVEQLTQALVQLLRQKAVHQYHEAQETINTASATILGLDMSLIRILSDEQIIDFFRSDDDIDAGKCLVVAELLFHDSDIMERQDSDDDFNFGYLKSLSLFLSAFIQEGDLLEAQYQEKVAQLQEKLADYFLPQHVEYKLFRYYELIGQYDKAENLLFDLASVSYPEIQQEGIAFFQRLLDKDDDALTAGNLPRNEVIEGLAELKKQTAEIPR